LKIAKDPHVFSSGVAGFSVSPSGFVVLLLSISSSKMDRGLSPVFFVTWLGLIALSNFGRVTWPVTPPEGFG
jgi:hypothetical protein